MVYISLFFYCEQLEDFYKPSESTSGYSAPARPQEIVPTGPNAGHSPAPIMESRDREIMTQHRASSQQGLASASLQGLHGMEGSSMVPQDSNTSGRAAVGVWCERCNSRLVELKKQALRLMIVHPNLVRLAMKVSVIEFQVNGQVSKSNAFNVCWRWPHAFNFSGVLKFG